MQVGGSVDPLNNKSETPLHLAAEEGHIEVVRYLIEKGADVAAKADRSELPPLHQAARHNHVDVVRYLLQISRLIDPLNVHPNHTASAYMGATSSRDSHVCTVQAAFDINVEARIRGRASLTRKAWILRFQTRAACLRRQRERNNRQTIYLFMPILINSLWLLHVNFLLQFPSR
jgi:ankyrin repeat protein